MNTKDFHWPADRDWKDVAYESIPAELTHTRAIWIVAQMHDSRLVKVGPIEPWDGVAAWFKAIA